MLGDAPQWSQVLQEGTDHALDRPTIPILGKLMAVAERRRQFVSEAFVSHVGGLHVPLATSVGGCGGSGVL